MAQTRNSLAGSEKILAEYLPMGGSLNPDPDSTSPFYDPEYLQLLEQADLHKTYLEIVLQRYKLNLPPL